MQYTDDMLAKLQFIIEHSIRDNKLKYDSLLDGLEDVLSVVNNNRNELKGATKEAEEDNNASEAADVTSVELESEVAADTDN
jgi:hypothetical protein